MAMDGYSVEYFSAIIQFEFKEKHSALELSYMNSTLAHSQKNRSTIRSSPVKF